MQPGFRMSVGADRNEVTRVNAAFGEFAEAHALPVAIRRSMNVAIDELLTNAISYGLAEGGGGEVTVDVELLPDRLTVTLIDDGKPFDPFGKAVPDTALPMEERPIGGLGIHLVRQLMDEVSYQRRGDRNVVSVAKLLKHGMRASQSGGRSMDITTRTQDGVTFVAFKGSLDSKTSPDAQQAIDGVLNGGGKKVVIDFTALDYISSAGLRVLLGTAKRLKGAGGALHLVGLNDSVREVFDISGFSSILAVFPTEADAVKAF